MAPRGPSLRNCCVVLFACLKKQDLAEVLSAASIFVEVIILFLNIVIHNKRIKRREQQGEAFLKAPEALLCGLRGAPVMKHLDEMF